MYGSGLTEQSAAAAGVADCGAAGTVVCEPDVGVWAAGVGPRCAWAPGAADRPATTMAPDSASRLPRLRSGARALATRVGPTTNANCANRIRSLLTRAVPRRTRGDRNKQSLQAGGI